MFAALFATGYAAHQLGDHLTGQTDWLAEHKADRGPVGWAALVGHLAGYHFTQVVMVAVAVAVLDLPLAPAGAAAGLAISVASHGLWDRRAPVRWLLERTGSPGLAATASHGMNGMYVADQALHVACLWAAALAATALS
ncbi:DUF3307 domain-containing protein [Frankia sp. CH37]|nr:DUF3307 domain-containing protein [Parafrankia sp. CH37]